MRASLIRNSLPSLTLWSFCTYSEVDLWKLGFCHWLFSCHFSDSELEDLETPPRYRPDSLEALCKATRFTQAEIKRIYRGFKAECPTGVVKEETFKVIYSQFFPQGGEYKFFYLYLNILKFEQYIVVNVIYFLQYQIERIYIENYTFKVICKRNLSHQIRKFYFATNRDKLFYL